MTIIIIIIKKNDPPDPPPTHKDEQKLLEMREYFVGMLYKGWLWAMHTLQVYVLRLCIKCIRECD